MEGRRRRGREQSRGPAAAAPKLPKPERTAEEDKRTHHPTQCHTHSRRRRGEENEWLGPIA
jgi:hypothetical protein